LLVQLRQSRVIHSDETGWKIGGHNAWLWVFTNEQLSVYLIDPRRGHEVVESILGTDFAGVLVSDCFLAYDALHYTKAKCAGHLLKRCKALTESGNRTAVQFSQQLACLLRGGIKLKERQSRLTAHGYRVACGKLEAALDRLLERHYRQPDTARFAKLLRKQREHLFTFLYVAEVAPTNNAAERELRPAVIIRKTNGCNRSPEGATAHSILSSVIRTCEKQGLDFIDQTRKVLQAAQSMLLDLCGSDPDPPALPADEDINPALGLAPAISPCSVSAS
jgi:transposase